MYKQGYAASLHVVVVVLVVRVLHLAFVRRVRRREQIVGGEAAARCGRGDRSGQRIVMVGDERRRRGSIRSAVLLRRLEWQERRKGEVPRRRREHDWRT